MTLGIAVRSTRGAPGVLEMIGRAEAAGIDAVWMSGGAGAESITTLAAATDRTRRVKLGTAVVQSPLRHPVALAQEARSIAQLAPGRFRLGVGPSHRSLMEPLGIEFKAPLSVLREYLSVLLALIHDGGTDFHGDAYNVRYSLGDPVDLPVMISALRTGSFALAGELSNGAISWFCPPSYLRDVALPAMRRAAEAAARETPPLIAHSLVHLGEDRDRLREIAGQPAMTAPLRLPFYQRMFSEAGFPEAALGSWSDSMIEAAIISGGRSEVEERLADILRFGNVELMVTPLVGGPDPDAAFAETIEQLAEMRIQ